MKKTLLLFTISALVPTLVYCQSQSVTVDGAELRLGMTKAEVLEQLPQARQPRSTSETDKVYTLFVTERYGCDSMLVIVDGRLAEISRMLNCGREAGVDPADDLVKGFGRLFIALRQSTESGKANAEVRLVPRGLSNDREEIRIQDIDLLLNGKKFTISISEPIGPTKRRSSITIWEKMEDRGSK